MKKTLGWVVYFLVCGAVIIAGTKAGMQHQDCNECEFVYTLSAGK